MKKAKVDHVTFSFSPPLNIKKTHKNTYISYTKVYEKGQLLRERQQGVEFKVVTQATKYNAQKKNYSVEMTTVEKVGNESLHEMGFPELNETLFFTINKSSDVVNVKNKKKNSIFYIPAIPFPKEKVKVGETWLNKYNWLNNNGVPLRVEIVSILKNIYQCPGVGVCAEVEVSGEAGIDASVATSIQLTSKLRGLLLVNVETGESIWSIVRNEEEMRSGSGRIESKSCTSSVGLNENIKAMGKIKADCDPKLTQVDRLPF